MSVAHKANYIERHCSVIEMSFAFKANYIQRNGEMKYLLTLEFGTVGDNWSALDLCLQVWGCYPRKAYMSITI